MGFLSKLFGRNPQQPQPAAPAKPSAPAAKNELISVVDQYGRQLQITRQQWRDNVLTGNIEKAWNDPDHLYSLIVSALQDDFRSDILAAAKHLHEIDPDPVRGACTWGVVLIEEGRLDEAESILRGYLNSHGDHGLILTNLAKVYSKRNNEAKAEEILWHAIETDPNQDNALLWYEAIQRERNGPQAATQSLEKIASLPGSWRAPLWLARKALDSGQVGEAMASYSRSLSLVTKPIPTDLLMQMSGDLGNHGQLRELVAITEPHYEAKVHGITVGNNLIKAHLDLGHLDVARKLVDELYALNRLDWKSTLNYWDTEIAKARVSTKHVDASAIEMGMLGIDGPVWLHSTSSAMGIFPAKASDELAISFLGSSVQSANAPNHVEVQLADTAGRLSRALPLFLTEQIYFGTRARAYSLIPWIVQGGSGFVLSGRAWTDQEAAEATRKAPDAADYVVIIHLVAKSGPWQIELRIVRTKDAVRLASLDAVITPDRPEMDLPQLAERLRDALLKHATLRPQPFPDSYCVPSGDMLAHYLLRLEQSLAVRCATMEGVPHEFLHGEREILDGMLHLCLWLPSNVTTRLLLSRTILSMKKTRPAIPGEYVEKLLALQKEHPLTAPVDRVMQETIDQISKP